ncbi:MAG: glycosyl hydrolase family 18 protein [Bacteroidales bacterium]|nr:glycosyl hydrolase family 18 protein [Bacteroidales bacterium]
MKKAIIIVFSLAFVFRNFIIAQYIPIHLLHQQEFGSITFEPSTPITSKNNSSCQLEKIIFGWHPYWSNGLEVNYQWNLISDLCYFSYEFDPATGNPTNTHNWATASVVTTALNQGKRVSLCITLFSNHGTFLTSSTARSNLITNVLNAVQNRNAHGINIDFEGVSSTYKTQLTSFIQQIADSLHQRIPNSILTVALPAVDWSNVWDIAALNSYVDYFIIMGYDYYYSGSTTAGPSAPLYTFGSFDYNYSRTITSYLNKGIPPQKLLMGVPYYGIEWQTTSLTIPSSTVTTGSSRTYKTVRTNASGNYNSANQRWEANSMSNYWAYTSAGKYYQCWVDNVKSMARKFEFINMRGLAGIGIWALGYDDGYTDFWDLIASKFSTCSNVACSDTIYDMGGPGRNYYDNENLVFTLRPTNAVRVMIQFHQFELEAGYDSLWIYDGPNTSSPLIGGYSGTNSPGNISSTQPYLTIRFRSNGTTTKIGWMATYQCIYDDIPPITSILPYSQWITDTTWIYFEDQDNTEVIYQFWNLAQFKNQTYRGDPNQGFLYETFDDSLPTNAITYVGDWTVSQSTLIQLDSSEGNTNLSFPLKQDSSHIYLYSLRFRFGSPDHTNNRRCGFHYFCSDPSQINRGNSYMAWFRCDNQKVQMYKYINNTMYLIKDVTYPFTPWQWYEAKVLYNPMTGYHAVWINNTFVTSWTDASFYRQGIAISLRTGNSKVWFDDFKVFLNRLDSVLLTVGTDSNNLIWVQNPNPTTPAALVSSLVIDKYQLISNLYSKELHVDYTPPTPVLTVNDFGLSGPDYDEIISPIPLTYNATWVPSTDAQSGLSKYILYLYKNHCHDELIYGPIEVQDTFSFLTNIESGYQYFLSIQAQNKAGLISSTTCSDGISVLLPTEIEHVKNIAYLYPNPCTSELFISASKETKAHIFDVTGQLVKEILLDTPITRIDIANLSAGFYFIKTESGEYLHFIKK